MMRFAALCFALVLFGSAAGHSLNAQQPSQPEVVVQAANTAVAAPAPSKPAATSDDSTLQTAIKALQEAKRANDGLLKKQEATLQQLDEVQKAAEQLKIFSKRG
jgi:hypothetical protein